ncbi:unnamed protein product [Lota lota]
MVCNAQHRRYKMLSDSSTAVRLGDDVLQDWKLIGRGGFGAVYYARQKDWRFDVAVKMLHTNDSEQLWKEAQNMIRASSQFVLRVFGVYQGIPPGGTTDKRVGIIIEYMKRGTLESLLEVLPGPPPWPLAFRLAHQLALGMNFLHTMAPPLLHRDLKPSNVLLDDDLNAKLADFGLSRVSCSVLKNSGKTTGDQGGTIYFTPPEAFQLSYQPVRSYDIYSYGIVIWSILTGAVMPSLVALLVPLGERPLSDAVDQSQAEGLSDLVKLMERCWHQIPDERPSFGDCLEVTNGVFSRHEIAIRHAVDQVLSKLDSESQTQQNPKNACVLQSINAVSSQVHSRDIAHCHSIKKEDLHKKGPVDGVKLTKPLSNEEKAKFVDNHRANIIQEVSMAMAIIENLGNMVHPETYSEIQAKDKNQDKIRVLYSTTLHSGGVKVKAAFYDGLETHEPNLLEMMNRKSSP